VSPGPGKYVPGATLLFLGTSIRGVVVPNYKLPGDVCVEWEGGQRASYDVEFLDRHCKVLREGP
jgi:hypothetical protein